MAGAHEIIVAENGRQIQISRHLKDLGKGLILGILNDVGLDLSWDQLLRE